MALFRAGCLPLAYETGRYSRPPVPIDDRLCLLCDNSSVETEKHFLIECSLYSDIRYKLFLVCSNHIENFNILDDENFLSVMKCNDTQRVLCYLLNRSYIRRKLFLN